MSRLRPVFVLVAIAMAGVVARAGVTSALIAKELDSQQDLKLDATLPEALQQVANQTGVTVQPDPAVWDLLPWGEQTTVKATTTNCTLGQGLRAVARTLGLELVQTDDTVELRPSPPLKRLGRRASVQELAVLDLLAAQPANLGTDRPTVRDLLAGVDRRLVELKSSFAVEDRAPDAAQGQTVVVPRNATLSEALEAIPKQTAATWYPWGRSLSVVPKEEQVRTQLGKSLTARYAGVDVGQVVLELAQRAGVEFAVEPGAYARVPANARGIQMVLDNATVQQALDNLSGYTGLTFEVTDRGVHVVGPAAATTKPVP